jgi:hypothetical protein
LCGAADFLNFLRDAALSPVGPRRPGSKKATKKAAKMAVGSKRARTCLALIAGVAALSATPASAGFFERLFGSFSHHQQPSENSQSYVEPFTDWSGGRRPQQRADTGPARAFCVRGCDGRYFPVQASAGISAAEACHSFCPAAQTKLYSGSNIDYAAASDGSRYADSDNAYRYRKEMVAGCSCNGRDTVGLAHINPANDRTLRPGDVLATKNGLVAVTGTHDNATEVTPIASYRAMPASERAKLAGVKIQDKTPAADVASSIAPISLGDANRSAQLDK